MSGFLETLFGGSRFVRWAITPALLLTLVVVPLCIPAWNPTRVVLMVGFELAGGCLVAGLWCPPRISRRLFRCVTGLVFVAYTAYLADQVVIRGKPLRPGGESGEASAFNALRGFLLIGLPCLWFTVTGRFFGRLKTGDDSPSPPGANPGAGRQT